ncbi:MAG: RIP metalloprotease RseP [Marinilabiliaceae bacterium]|nr:RIP metalloprotease RseP [Marinilabiliaceae bacterium]
MEILIKAGQLILSLSILVIIHEFGHFFFARLFKTRVEKFYLFFDAWFSLFKFKKGDTEYGIGWIPLGGYVKISGMIDESMDKEQMKQPAQPWEFRSKKPWQRLLIMTGGVVVNFVAAIIIFWMLLYSNGEAYISSPEMKYGVQFDSKLHEIGFKDGDIILRIDSLEVDDLNNDFSKKLLLENPETVTVKRADSLVVVNIPDNYGQELIGAGVKKLVEMQMPFVIDSIIPNYPAAQSNLAKGDSIVSVNDSSAGYYHLFVARAQKLKNQNVKITVKRDTSLVDVDCFINEQGLIGVGNKPIAAFFKINIITYGFWEAMPAGVDKGFTTLFDYAKQLKKVFTKEGVTQIGGFGMMGSLFPATWDWTAFWSLTALISVILAFMNILPIPALDGGHVMFLLYEIITKRKPSEKFMEYAQVAGMVFLLALLLYANGNDIFKLFYK